MMSLRRNKSLHYDQELISNDRYIALCQDLFSDPVSFIPCLHTYCLQCTKNLSRANSETNCPICREKVQGVRKNFMASSFLRIYLEVNSDIKKMKNEESGISLESPNARSTAAIMARTFQAVEYDQFRWDRKNFAVTDYKPCRSCIPNNPTGYMCPVPLEAGYATSELNPIGHLFCTFCQTYMPARGTFGMPALDQACSFCGVVACDSYWGCFNHSHEAKLFLLKDIGDLDDFEQIFLTKDSSLSSPEEGYLNFVEIKYLKAYLKDNKISWKEAWKSCTDMFDSQDYICSAASSLTLPAQDICRQIENAGREHFTSINVIAPRGNTIKRPQKPHEPTTKNINSTPTSRTTSNTSIGDRQGRSLVEPGIPRNQVSSRLNGFTDENHPSGHLMACYSCANDITNGQLFGYWKNIPVESLPAHIGLRDVCEWGEECTVQWAEDGEHAKQYSHVDHI
ncbi:hypothetical protein F4703DRAFT_1789538 [Phycomyces blakesleeanus]